MDVPPRRDPTTPGRRSGVDDELAFHVEMQTRRFIAEGVDSVSARRRALERLGPIAAARRECEALARGQEQTMRHERHWQDLRLDVRHAVRALRQAPAFTVAAVLTLMLGIGASTAIFSVVNDTLIRRLPYTNADRLFVVWNAEGPDGLARDAIAAPEYVDIRDAGGAFDGVAGLSYQPGDLAGGCAGPGCEAERVNIYVASPHAFDVIGLRPALGRTFDEADGRANAPLTILLSEALWHRRFGADPSVIGRQVLLNSRPRTVIGVMPAGIRFPDVPLGDFRESADVWVPYDWARMQSDSRGNQFLLLLARLAPGLPARRAQADLDVIADRFRARYPDRYAATGRRWRLLAVPLRGQMVGAVRPELLMLLGAVGLVLLIACANVAHLMLARGRTRAREFALRAALGAPRARLVRLLLVEALVLASAGGLLGSLLAAGGVRALTALDPSALPRIGGAHVDAGVLAFACAVPLFVGLLVGIGPAFRHSRTNPREALDDGQRGAAAPPLSRRLRGLLAASEIAMALVVLVGAGLIVRSFRAMERVSLGFDPSHTLTFEVALPQARYDTAAKQVDLERGVTERLAALPGVAAASAVYPLPMSGEGWGGSFDVEFQEAPKGQEPPHAEYAVVLPRYFAAMRIPVAAGREFTPTDAIGAPKVVIVDETLARRFWPGAPETAVGKRLNPNGNPGDWATVVGVVGHVHSDGPRVESESQIYLPAAQRPQATLFFVARTAGDPAWRAADARAVVAALDPSLPISRLSRLSDVVSARTAHDRFALVLFVVFGGVSLVLAAIGLYGVLTFLVGERRRDIGIRLALGGTPGRIRCEVLVEALVMAGAGIAVGLLATVPAARGLETLLFQVEPTDAATYATIAALLIVVTAAAAAVPARRATRVNPLDALR